MVGNNVLAHVPELNDFVKGMKILLQLEPLPWSFPHLMRLMEVTSLTQSTMNTSHIFVLSTVERFLHGFHLRCGGAVNPWRFSKDLYLPF